MAEVPEGVVLDNPVPEGVVVDAAPPTAQFTRPIATIPAADKRTTPADEMTDASTVGRILDAFGQGAKAGWGSGSLGLRPLGLSPESEKWLRDNHIFDDYQGGLFTAAKAINEAFMRPTAALLDGVFRLAGPDGVFRLLRAGIYSLAGGAGQAAYETGLAETPGRATRDLVAMADTIMTVGGATPIGIVPRAGRAGRVAGAIEEAAPVAEDIRPVRPQATAEGIPPLVQSAADAEPRSAPMAPPATGTVDKAGNINLNYIGGGEDIKQIIRDTAENPNFNPKTRGPMTWEQIDDLAAQTGMDADKLAQRAVGEAWNAENIDAARQLLYQATNDVRDLGAKIRAGDTSEATLLKYAEAELKQVAVQEQVAGLADEAGRALGIFRKMAGTRQEADAVTEIVASMAGGKKGLVDRAKKIADLNDPAAASRTLREALDPTWKDRFFEVWYNVGLLSNPATHIANTSSNLAVALWSVPEQGMAGIVGALRRMAAGSTDGAYVAEAWARTQGLLSGAKEGLPAAWQAFKSERPNGAWSAGRDMPLMRAIPSTEGGWGGKQVRLAGRALMAEDEVFRAIGARQYLHQIAARRAIEEGNWSRYGELLANPTPEMLDEAAKAGAKQIFANPLGTNGQMIQHIVNDFGGGAFKILVPFVRTPANIIKYAGERSPLGVFSREVRANLSGANGAAVQDEAIARMFLGTMTATAMVALAVEGAITGGGPIDPEHPGRRALWLLENQPYHVKIGGYSIDYKRLTGPLGILLGVVADSKEAAHLMTEGEAKRLAALVGASITSNLVQQAWMQGPAQLVQAVNDPQRYGEKWIDRTVAAMLVPSVAAQAARIEDPYLKDARTMLDAIKARTPGLVEQVKPKRDIFGRPVDADFPLVALAKRQGDPVVQALNRVELWPTPPDRKINGVELTPEQYDRLQAWTGFYVRYMTEPVVSTPGFAKAPLFVQKEMLKGAIEAGRRMGMAKTKMGDPELLRSLFSEQMKRFAK